MSRSAGQPSNGVRLTQRHGSRDNVNMAFFSWLSPRMTSSCWLLSICVLGCAEGDKPTPNDVERRRDLELADLARKVQISKSDPPTGCVDAGVVEAINENYQGAITILKVRAARRGANYVVLDSVIRKEIPDSGGVGPWGVVSRVRDPLSRPAFFLPP